MKSAKYRKSENLENKQMLKSENQKMNKPENPKPKMHPKIHQKQNPRALFQIKI